MDSYDVVIVGGRCAGAATAMLLARAGLRVLVAERQPPGADTISGLMIKPDGLARLSSWGLLDDVLATGCPPIRTGQAVIAGTTVQAPLTDERFALAPRRTQLDPILQEHARRAGVEFRFSSSFRDREDGVIVIDQDRVRARLLIGADGRYSRVARAVGSAYAVYRPGRTSAWYGFWEGSPLQGLRLELDTGLFAGAFPTNDRQVLAFVQVPIGQWRAHHRTRDYLAGLQSAPSVHASVHCSRLASRVVGVRDQPSYLRSSAGAGWALVGDAAHHKDPLGARGIADAFLGADLLAHHVLSGWESDLDGTLEAYANELSSAFEEPLELNDSLARLNGPPVDVRDQWSRLARWSYRAPRTTAS